MDTVTDQLIVENKDGVGRITFDNQQRRNALTYEMWSGLPIVLADFAADDAVRVIVLAGAGGKAFSAGADISEFPRVRANAAQARDYGAVVAGTLEALRDCVHPTVAAIQGDPI